MDRRRFLLISLAAAFAAQCAAEGQQARKIPRLGYFSSSSADRAMAFDWPNKVMKLTALCAAAYGQRSPHGGVTEALRE